MISFPQLIIFIYFIHVGYQIQDSRSHICKWSGLLLNCILSHGILFISLVFCTPRSSGGGSNDSLAMHLVRSICSPSMFLEKIMHLSVLWIPFPSNKSWLTKSILENLTIIPSLPTSPGTSFCYGTVSSVIKYFKTFISLLIF